MKGDVVLQAAAAEFAHVADGNSLWALTVAAPPVGHATASQHQLRDPREIAVCCGDTTYKIQIGI